MRFKDLCLLSSAVIVVGLLMVRPAPVEAGMEPPARSADGVSFKFHELGSTPRYRLVFPS
jgi:hypothetical protein